MSGILRLESLTKGNTLKQGDKTPLKYRLFDADGEQLDIAGKTAVARLMYPDYLRVGYESEELTVSPDNTVTFSIDKIIQPILYYLEIAVDDKYIFPSRNDESKLNIDKSSKGSDIAIIEIIGKDVLVRDIKNMVDSEIEPVVNDMIVSNQKVIENEKIVKDVQTLSEQLEVRQNQVEQFNNQVITEMTDRDVISAPEIIMARDGFDTLGERLAQDGLKQSGYYSIDEFNVDGNDTESDDTLAIQQAFNTIPEGSVLHFPKGVYNISGNITVNKDVKVTGVEAIFNGLNFDSVTTMQFFGTPKSLPIDVAEDISINDTTISLSTVDGVEVGDIVHLQSSMLWYFDNRNSLYKGETFVVTNVDASTNSISASNAINDVYSLDLETITLRFYKPIMVNIDGLIFNNMRFSYSRAYDSIVNNCVIDYPNATSGLAISTSVNTLISNTTVKNCFNSTTGYGIQDNQSLSTTILNCKFENNRRGVDFSGVTPSRLGVVELSEVYTTDTNLTSDDIFSYSSGFGTHGTAENITFKNNILRNVRTGFISRGKSIVIKNNLMIGKATWFVSIVSGDDVEIDSNVYKTNTSLKSTDSYNYIYHTIGFMVAIVDVGVMSELKITNNNFERITKALLHVNTISFTNVDISNNKFRIQSNAGSNPVGVIFGITEITIDRLFYSGNNYTHTGDFEEFRNTVITSQVPSPI